MARDTVQAEVRPKLARYYKWVILALAAAAEAIGAIVGQGLPTMIPLFKDDLHLTRTEVGLFNTILNGVLMVMAVPSGMTIDRLGVRPILLISQIVIAVGVFALPLATSLASAIPMLVIAGIGFVAVTPATTVAIHSWFGVRGRGTAMSVIKTTVPFVGILSAAVLPALAVAIGWRTEMRGLGLMAITTGIIVFAFYRDRPGAKIASHATSVSLRSFVALVSEPNVLITSVYAAILSSAHLAVLSFLMLYLEETMGLSVVAAGGYLALAQAGAFIGRPIWGVASDILFRSRRRPPLILMGVIGIGALVAIGSLPSTAPLLLVSVIVFALGFSVIAWHGVYLAILSELASEGRAATAVGFSSMILQGARAALMPIFGFLVDTTHTYRWSWLGMALLLIVATALFAGVVREREERD